jgi:hypothetical protein
MSEPNHEVLQKLTKDLKVGAATLTTKEARFLTDLYYQLQDSRIRAAGQVRAIDQGADEGATHQTLSFFLGQFETLENMIKRALGSFADGRRAGRWLKSIMGIGDVISAGFLAHIDIDRAPHAGNLWRYAGLINDEWLGSEKAKALVKECEPETETIEDLVLLCAARAKRNPDSLRKMAMPEEGGEPTKTGLIKALALRPWNADLKVLCYKAGESFVKVSGNDKDYYGHLYAARKALYTATNMEGGFKGQAEEILGGKKFGKDTDAYKALADGKLPKAQIHARARRYAVKIFLSHLHEVMFEDRFGRKPAKPWIIDVGGHSDYMPPPGWPID